MNEAWPDIMTIEQVAQYLQLHPQVVYRHVRAGTLPASRIGRTIRFKKSVLDEFLAKTGWDSVGEYLKFRELRTEESVQAEKQEQLRRRRRFSMEVD